MAENVLIRTLPQPVTVALEKYKQEHDISVNTKAACGMMGEHYFLKEELAKVKAERDDITAKYGRLVYLLDQKKNIEDQITQILQDS